MSLAAWVIRDGPSTRLPNATPTELQLESWIDDDPSLVADGVRWIGRQVVLPDRSRLDLLGLTHDDVWIIAELKRGAVSRSTLAQALHYVLYVGSMEPGEFAGVLHRNPFFAALDSDTRESVDELLTSEPTDEVRRVMVLLVGTERWASLDVAARYLDRAGLTVPIRSVVIELFEAPTGETLLLREANDIVTPDAAESRGGYAAVADRAALFGCLPALQRFEQLAQRLGLARKAWSRSVTVTARKRGNPTILYLRPEPSGLLHVWTAIDRMQEHLGLSDAEIAAIGPGGDFTLQQVESFAARFENAVESSEAN